MTEICPGCKKPVSECDGYAHVRIQGSSPSHDIMIRKKCMDIMTENIGVYPEDYKSKIFWELADAQSRHNIRKWWQSQHPESWQLNENIIFYAKEDTPNGELRYLVRMTREEWTADG